MGKKSNVSPLNVHVCVYSDPLHSVKLYGIGVVNKAMEEEEPYSCRYCVLYDVLLNFLVPLQPDEPADEIKPDNKYGVVRKATIYKNEEFVKEYLYYNEVE